MSKDISNSDDLIDSRDVIKRIEELEEERDSFVLENSSIDEEKSPSWGEVAEAQGKAIGEWNETDEGEELADLLALQDEAEGYSDWIHGATLIRESHFEEYAREYIADCYSLKDIPQILQDNIDWKGVAEDLQADFTSVEFDGVTYYVR